MTDTAAIRAEIDDANEIAPWTIAWLQMTARSLCDDLDAAEARIAAVLAYADDLAAHGYPDTAAGVRRAITGTTP